MASRTLRRKFASGLLYGLGVVWPIVSILLLLMAGLGVIVGLHEGWTFTESLYFAYVTGLTIGYGDLSPKTFLGRTLAIFIGLCGILFTALLAGVAAKALAVAQEDLPPTDGT